MCYCTPNIRTTNCGVDCATKALFQAREDLLAMTARAVMAEGEAQGQANLRRIEQENYASTMDELAVMTRDAQALEDALAAMTARAEQLAAMTKRAERAEALLDCGQRTICAIAPGCLWHFIERNGELVRDRDASRAEVKRLRDALARIAGGAWPYSLMRIASDALRGEGE